jgi:hypothetical protein
MLQRVNDRLESLSDGAFLALALALWFLTAIVLINTLPLLPVDETRYATVAWEMRQSGCPTSTHVSQSEQLEERRILSSS